MSGSFLSLSEDSFCETLSSAGDVAMAPPPSKLHPNGSALLMRLVTEDTPPDMLAGSMDLRVTLPNGTTVKMSVERSTPMMDLLIQITTANKVSPGDYILQVLGDKGILPYKPSTPIGALDTLSIRVVPRHSTANNNPHNNSLNRKRIPLINSLIGQQQPFEQTFRLQVHLPRNQLFVARLSPRTSLAEILVHVCEEKNLDPNKYELRHPVNTDQSLQLSLCLADYKITEIVVVPRGSRPSTELSSSDIPALQRSNSEQRNGSSATSSGSGSGGVLSILKRNKSDGNREGSLSGDSLGGRSSSPARSDESLSRSISPPAGKIMDRQNMAPPPPVRHRKGRAPKPPAAPSVPAVEVEEATSKPAEPKRTTALVISHSRNSSDSSGYHEASVLSDTPDNLNGHSTSPSDTINRKSSKAAPTTSSTAAGAAAGKLQYSLSMSDVSKTDAPGRMSNATSTSSLSNKKKKAPAPPPAVPPPSALPSRSSSRSSSVLEPSVCMLDNPVVEAEASPLNPPVPRARRLTPDAASPTPPPIRPRKPRLPRPDSGLLFRRQASSNSLVGSVGSSTGSFVFGVGRSVLSFNVNSENGSENTYEDIDNDLDLSLFEGSTGGSTIRTTDILLEEDEEYANFHNSLLSEQKRNSLTKILNEDNNNNKKKPSRKKAPAPKAPKNIGHRRRPKLGEIEWETQAEEDIKVEELKSLDFEKAKPGKKAKIVETSSRDFMLTSQRSTLSVQSLRSTHDEFGFPLANDYEEVGHSTDELDLDLDLFAMTNQPHANSGAQESAEKLPAKDLPSPAEPVTVRTENGHMDNGSHCEEDLEVQVQSMDVGKAESEYASDDEDDLDSAFQSVTDVLEKQLEAEERLLKQQKIVQVENEEDLSKTPSPAPQVEEVEENIKEEDPRLVQERLGKEKLLKELEVKKALHEKQRMEIERLQKEQQELELALKKFEMESQNEEKKQDSIPISPEPSDIPDWEYKLPAPPTAFRDSKETATPSNTPEEEKRRLSFDLKPTEVEKETPRIEIVPPLPDIIIQQPDILIDQQESVHEEEEVKRFVEEEDPEMRPKPPAIVDVTIKPAVVSELPKRRSASPPRVTIMPLRAAHSLCSLVYDHRDNKQQDEEEVPRRGSGSDSDSDRVLSPLRKTTSVDDVSKSTAQNEAPVQEEEQRLQQLQQQLLTWQKQLITNQSVLQEHVDMPLQSLQVLREILPQMKQKLEEDAMNGTSTTTITETITSRSSTLPRGVRSLDMEVSDPTVYRGSNTLERRTVVTSSSSSSVQQRFRPPTINLGTWSERPKSEIALKQDSDYRVGVGQLQARAAPIVRQAEPKPKETLHLLGSNGDPVTRSNSWRVLQQPPYKSSVTIHSLATEQVRASNKPTVILRQNPPASYHQSLEQQSEFAAPKGPQKRYTTLVGLNGAPQPTQVTQQHQPVVIAQVAPSVKGFAAPSSNAPVKISPLTAPKPTPVPPPPPPAQQLQQPMVIRPTAPPKKKLPVQTSEAPRDQLMDAIKNFGGRSNLRRVRSTQ
ncbi:uncharacterized protein LOC132192632 isoform X2 [Neocloeon triangulifer]|uniref:uncharacterized protein LOC132192632 isoform X2 n=1 Tax=Neocloeon triangulifer TaxID=2078957 RepID=UPI00286F4EA0|nr:uncharacterized protein LOC132192632 isoform X2 [Neocloeon triangulifer]